VRSRARRSPGVSHVAAACALTRAAVYSKLAMV
jgi:hypothetical protein